jgi:hypothetical protein
MRQRFSLAAYFMLGIKLSSVEFIVGGRNKFVKDQGVSQLLAVVDVCISQATSNTSYTQMLNIYRVSKDKCARIREGVPYVKVYRYNPKHLCPKLNGYGDNGQRKLWFSGGSTHCTCQLTVLSMPVLECGVILRQFS